MWPLVLTLAVSTQAMTNTLAVGQVFREVELAIRSPASLRCEVEVTGLADSSRLLGILTIAPGNRVRAEQTVIRKDGDTVQSVLICDGRRRFGQTSISNSKPTPIASRSPSVETAALTRQGLARGGWLDALLRVNGPDDRTDTREILMGFYEPPEITNLMMEQDSDTILLRYRIGTTSVFGGPTSHVRLWIDPKTMLPTRREITTESMTVRETYKNWERNAEVPTSAFQLPTP